MRCRTVASLHEAVGVTSECPFDHVVIGLAARIGNVRVVPARFDLITVDVVEPRATAAAIIDRTDLHIELDEDDGRWLVLSSPTEPQRFGLQRSDPREVAARLGCIEDVLDGCLTLAVSDVLVSARFFGAALALTGNADRLEFEGRPVLRLVDGGPAVSNLHLDLVCGPDEFDEELDRLLDLGAIRVGARRTESWGETQILTAPAGGLVCLNAYR